GWVHGDLSAYNVLATARGPVIIDFPQSVSASHNTQARRLVERDVRNVTTYLAGFAPELERLGGAGAEIWRRYEQGELGADFVPGAAAPAAAAALDPQDELAAQIAAAQAMPCSVGRARGRRARAAAKAETPSPAREEQPPR